MSLPTHPRPPLRPAAPRRALACAAFGVAALVAVLPARGAEPAAPPAAPALDRLMKLPDTIEYTSEKRAGATRSEWRHRFEEARERVVAAEAALAKAQAELAKVVGSKDEWQFTPPGLPAGVAADSTSNFQLRQEVKRQRSEVARARHRLRDLEVEANLAGVPRDWRGASTDPQSDSETVLERGAAP